MASQVKCINDTKINKLMNKWMQYELCLGVSRASQLEIKHTLSDSTNDNKRSKNHHPKRFSLNCCFKYNNHLNANITSSSSSLNNQWLQTTSREGSEGQHAREGTRPKYGFISSKPHQGVRMSNCYPEMWTWFMGIISLLMVIFQIHNKRFWH